jgi:hypothetical protein
MLVKTKEVGGEEQDTGFGIQEAKDQVPGVRCQSRIQESGFGK